MKILHVSLWLLLASASVFASLGGPESSIHRDTQKLNATKKVVHSMKNYSIHELDSHGTLIREYISSSGIVFGIAWRGLVHPELGSLLGSYAAEYSILFEKNLKQNGARTSSIRTDNIVVEKWGHMRNLAGHAFIPSLLPEGLSPNEIR